MANLTLNLDDELLQKASEAALGDRTFWPRSSGLDWPVEGLVPRPINYET